MKLTKEEQLNMIRGQVNSEHAAFTPIEKIQYLKTYFEGDPMIDQENVDTVKNEIIRSM